jgi:hypothetical protein
MALPALPLLDDFNRPDETPLSDGGNWVVWPTFGTMNLRSHNAVRSTVASACYAQWTAQTFAASQVAAGTISGWNTSGGDGGDFLLLACSDNIGANAYEIELDVLASGAPAFLHLRRLGAHAWLKVCTLVGLPATIAVGDGLALNINGQTIEAWYAVAGAWTLIDTADDFVLSGGNPAIGPGKVAIGGNLATVLTPGPAWSAAYGGVGGQLYRLPVLGAG